MVFGVRLAEYFSDPTVLLVLQCFLQSHMTFSRPGRIAERHKQEDTASKKVPVAQTSPEKQPAARFLCSTVDRMDLYVVNGLLAYNNNKMERSSYDVT